MAEKKKKILIIDDEKDYLKAMDRFLSDEGFSVVTCDTGRKGINRVKKEPFDLFLIDIIMPKMDGLTVIKKIEEIAPESVFLIITGYKITAEVRDFLEHDKAVYSHFNKPFDMNALVEKTKEILGEDA